MPKWRGGVRARGVTLVELLVVLALLAILLGMAAPSMADMLWRNRLAGATNVFTATLALARQESIKTGQRVVLCRGDPAQGCLRSGAGWEHGALVFVDINNDALWDSADDRERLVSVIQPLRGVALSGNTPLRHYVSFEPGGTARTINGALQMGTFTLQAPGVVVRPANQLVLSSSGRVRLLQLDNVSPRP